MKRCYMLVCFICLAMQLNCQNVNVPQMVFIKGGTFLMGCDNSDKDEKPRHRVTLTDFSISKYEITNIEFKDFILYSGYVTSSEFVSGPNYMNTTTPLNVMTPNSVISTFIFTGGQWQKRGGLSYKNDEVGDQQGKQDSLYPVIFVSQKDAKAYCKWLSKKTGKKFRLPTEAEWEYVASSRGKNLLYSWGDSLPQNKFAENVADKMFNNRFPELAYFHNYMDGFLYRSPVGTFLPNELGVCDIGGNVREWCIDFYDESFYKAKSSTNPICKDGSKKVIRGGSWFSGPKHSRITFRDNATEEYSDSQTGFRIVEEIK